MILKHLIFVKLLKHIFKYCKIYYEFLRSLFTELSGSLTEKEMQGIESVLIILFLKQQ